MSQTSSSMLDESKDVWQRKGQLVNLRTLRMDCPQYFTVPFLRHVFERSPTLAAFHIQRETIGREKSFAMELAAIIRINSPSLRQVRIARAHETLGSRNGALTIATSLAPRPLQGVHLDHLEGARSNRSAQKIVSQHRTTLQDIRFLECQTLEKRTINRILSTCQAVERLQIKQAGASLAGLRVKNLVKRMWVCQNMTYLELPVHETHFQDTMYYQHCHRRFEPEQEDAKLWSRWKELYTTIGQLWSLETLKLRRVENHQGQEAGIEHTLPAKLALGNIRRRELGYLQLLSDLRQLKAL
ncbi:hypothetical protein BGW39_003384, partial [Mortierella sp. 14UC]